jgi:hypothetical protein
MILVTMTAMAAVVVVVAAAVVVLVVSRNPKQLLISAVLIICVLRCGGSMTKNRRARCHRQQPFSHWLMSC